RRGAALASVRLGRVQVAPAEKKARVRPGRRRGHGSGARRDEHEETGTERQRDPHACLRAFPITVPRCDPGSYHRSPALPYDLADRERLGPRRVALDAAEAEDRLERRGPEPRARRLAGERGEDVLHLSPRHRVGKGHVEVGRRELALVLGDLVLEDEVVAPGVPREARDLRVVLMQVVAVVREDDVGGDASLERLERVLELGADPGEVALAEVMDVDGRRAELRGAGPRLGGPLAIRGAA